MGGLRRAAWMCQGAAMARKTSVDGMRWNLGSSLSWRVVARYRKTKASGKTRPMKPLVRRLRAVTAAKARQGRSDELAAQRRNARVSPLPPRRASLARGSVEVTPLLPTSCEDCLARMRLRARRKAWTARVIQRATTMSGIKKRVYRWARTKVGSARAEKSAPWSGWAAGEMPEKRRRRTG